MLMRQFGPLMFMLLMSMGMNWLGSGAQSSAPAKPSYKFSYERTYSFPEKTSSYRLQQIYYVSPYTLRDFKIDPKLREATDDRVETEILNRLEQHCNEAQRKRQAFLNQSKRYNEHESMYNQYVQKAEAVDMHYCV